ncbi:MAG: serine O-acetyltransferase [Arcobacteraceae bacterium]|jgi:serine O-acetyltransferase
MKTFIKLLSADILMVRSKKTKSLTDVVYLLHPRVLPVLLVRISHLLTKYHLGILGKIIALLNQILFGCDIARGSKIDGGLYLPHPNGVVVGESAIIGKNCILHQGVTLGDRGELHKGDDPTIQDYVEIGTGAKILGAISIGRYARVGANSVVLHDVEAFGIAVGLPAKTISLRDDKNELEA